SLCTQGGATRISVLVAKSQRRQRSMLSETVEFNVGVLVAHGRPNGKSAFLPLITCCNESVEILAVGVTAGGTEKGSPVFIIAVKNSERGRVDIETATEPGCVGSDCSAIHVETAIVN